MCERLLQGGCKADTQNNRKQVSHHYTPVAAYPTTVPLTNSLC